MAEPSCTTARLLLNEQKLPLDFKANDVGLTWTISVLQRRYDGTLHIGKMDAQFQDYRDIPASADAEFSLWRNRAQVRSLKLTSQKSSVELSGTVDDFSHPQAAAHLWRNDRPGASGAISAVRTTCVGAELNISGSGDFAAGQLHYQRKAGRCAASTTGTKVCILRDASAGADFAVDRDHILLKKINARLLGGTVTGNAEVKNYAPTLAVTTAQVRKREAWGKARRKPIGRVRHPKTPGALPVQQGTANFKVSGASLAEVVRMLSSKALPLDKLNATGAVNGTVGLTWRESITRAIAELALDAVAPSQSETNQLPTSGTLRGHYDVHSGLLDSAQLEPGDAAHRGECVRGTGITRRAVEGRRHHQQPAGVPAAVELQWASHRLPVELNGRASFNGTLSGRIDAS